MAKENINFNFRLRKTDETRNYLSEEINHNELTNEKHKKVYGAYFEHLFLLSIFSFASLVGVPVGIASSELGLKIYAITAEIKKYKLIIKKRRRIIIR